jgi:hypothetical protein
LTDEEWEEYFKSYTSDIDDLDSMIMSNNKFLAAKYKELKSEIEEEKKRGITYEKCSWCGFESAKLEDIWDLLYSRHCRVCFHQNNTLHIKCPDCGNEVLIEELGSGNCSNCDFESDIDYLISTLAGYHDPKEESELAYCAECEYSSEPSVICLSDEKGIYLCLYCLTIHDHTGKCGFCDTYIAGRDLEGSYSFGCIFCDGAAGYDDS